MRALLDHLPLLVLLGLAAAIDLRSRRIPNWLTLGLIASGLARAAVAGGPIGVGAALAGIAVGAAPPLVLYVLGAVGAADVKLLAGVGAWLGAPAALAVFVVQCVIGLVLVLAQAISRGRLSDLFRNSAVLAAGMAHQGVTAYAPGKDAVAFTSIDRPLPYAVPVGLATVAVLAVSQWIA